jgi:hypothetical protein
MPIVIGRSHGDDGILSETYSTQALTSVVKFIQSTPGPCQPKKSLEENSNIVLLCQCCQSWRMGNTIARERERSIPLDHVAMGRSAVGEYFGGSNPAVPTGGSSGGRALGR